MTQKHSKFDVVGEPMQYLGPQGRVFACQITDYDEVKDTYEVLIMPSQKLDQHSKPYPIDGLQIGDKVGQIRPVGGFEPEELEEDEEAEKAPAPTPIKK